MDALIGVIIGILFSIWLFGGFSYQCEILIMKRKIKKCKLTLFLNFITLPQKYIAIYSVKLGILGEKFMNKITDK